MLVGAVSSDWCECILRCIRDCAPMPWRLPDWQGPRRPTTCHHRELSSARLLFLCCFQVTVFAGRNIFAPKVCEFGGNTFGVGSNSVLGEGWPQDAVRVEGESITFSFQVRSSRERATQDNAVWGFACSITAKVSAGAVWALRAVRTRAER